MPLVRRHFVAMTNCDQASLPDLVMLMLQMETVLIERPTKCVICLLQSHLHAISSAGGVPLSIVTVTVRSLLCQATHSP